MKWEDPVFKTVLGTYVMPGPLHRAVVLWIEKGIVVSDFLCAVLESNLKEAVLRADDRNRGDLTLIVHWLYERAPERCWGSPEKARKWQKAGGLEGQGLKEKSA